MPAVFGFSVSVACAPSREFRVEDEPEDLLAVARFPACFSSAVPENMGEVWIFRM